MTEKIRIYQMLVALSVIMPALLLAIVMWQDYRTQVEETQRDVTRRVEVLEQHAFHVFETHHLVCERINEHLRGMTWDEVGRAESIRQYLQGICDKYPQVQAVWLADSSGIVRNASRPLPAKTVSVADRDYFRALAGTDADLFIGHLVPARVMNGLNFNIAHRRDSSTGAFDGIIIVTVFPDYFIRFWNKTIQGQDIAAGLIRSDGMFLARAPRLDPGLSKLPATSSTMRAIRDKEQGSYFGTSAYDNSERYFAFRKVGGYNLYMIYGVGTKAVLREWLQHVLFYGTIFGVAALALTLLALLTLKRARREQEAKHELNLAYAEMESRVQKRTSQLSMANTELANEIEERTRIEDRLNQLNEELEQRVEERTAGLEEKNRELERLNRLFVGRELKMIELKERIRELEGK